jgi:hypothetical protein
MKKITNGMTDEKGEYNKNRGHLSDGVIGLALLQRQPGSRSGLDHFGFAVENVQRSVIASKSLTPISTLTRAQGHEPFAGLRARPGTEQPIRPFAKRYGQRARRLRRIRLGTAALDQSRLHPQRPPSEYRPSSIRKFSISARRGMSGDNSYYLTDGK